MFCEGRAECRIETRRQYGRLSLLICLLCCFVSCSGPGEEEKGAFESFPVPLRIDFGECLETSLYVKCRFKAYDRSYAQFAAERTGQAERALQAAISAIREKDAEAGLDLCSGNAGLKSEKKERYTANIDKMIKHFADEVHDGHSNDLRIDMQYYIGNRRLFVWGWDSASESSEPHRIWLIFERNSANELLWNPQLDRLDDFSMLLVDIARQRARSEGDFKAVEKQGFAYEVAIPGTTEGDTAYLQFNGQVYDCNIFEDSVNPDDEVLSFYQQACHVLRDRPMEEFAQLYTRKSRQNIMERLSDVEGRDHLERWYRDDLTESGIKVLFIMDAKPFYFVFYRKNRSTNKAIRFTDVVIDPEDNKLKLTNFNYSDYLHEFLSDRGLFTDPILKSLIKQGSR